MAIYVALLRSVNVAGHGRISMDQLRASFESLGFADVATYIQTGNVVFSTPVRTAGTLVEAIEGRLDEVFGVAPAVILRSAAQIRAVENGSPYAAQGMDPTRHHVTFLAAQPDAVALARFDPPPSGHDELVVDGREVYVHTPDGYGRTKYSGAFLERRLGVLSTTRNWNTVTKLSAMVR